MYFELHHSHLYQFQILRLLYQLRRVVHVKFDIHIFTVTAMV